MIKTIDNSLNRGNLNSALDQNKSKIIEWGMPNYSAGVSLSEGSTVGKNSIIYVKGVSSEGKSILTLFINGVEVGSNSSYGNDQTVSCYAIAQSGATITTSRTQIKSYTIKYFPLKGA